MSKREETEHYEDCNICKKEKETISHLINGEKKIYLCNECYDDLDYL